MLRRGRFNGQGDEVGGEQDVARLGVVYRPITLPLTVGCVGCSQSLAMSNDLGSGWRSLGAAGSCQLTELVLAGGQGPLPLGVRRIGGGQPLKDVHTVLVVLARGRQVAGSAGEVA